MAEMCKRILIVLAIVVVLVLAIDVSCVDGNLGDEFQALNSNRGNIHNANSTLVTADGNTHFVGRSYDTAPTTGGRFKVISFGITILLLIVAVVVTMGYNVSSIVSPKRDIFEKSQLMQSSMNEPPNADADHLHNVTRQLATALPNSAEQPPLDLISIRDSENDAIEEETTDIMSTENYATLDPISLCYDIARNVYDMIEEKVLNSMISVFELDRNSAYNINAIKAELARTNITNCGAGFFEIVELYNGEGLSFSYENDIIKSTMDTVVCKHGAKEMVPILYELNTYSTEVNCTITLPSSNENTSRLVDGLILTFGTSCGDGYYDLTGSSANSLTLQYKSTNYYISQAWKSFFEEQACQAAADTVVPLLHEVRGRTYKTNCKNTILDTKNLRTKLIDALNIAEGRTCGYGFLKIQQNDDNVVVTYRTPNPFMAKAWKKFDLINVPGCETAVQEVLPFLRELNLYSPEADGSLVIPNEGQNIRKLIRKLASAEEINCGVGFFTRVDENGVFKLKFNKENIHIKPHWV